VLQRQDRQEDLHRLRLSTFGVGVEVRGVDASALGRIPVDRSWRGDEVEGPSVAVVEDGSEFLVRRDGDVVVRVASREQAERFAVDEIEHAVAERSPFVFLHAGAVTIGGTVVVIPGSSRSGKSTLVRALLAAGATYLSDEYAVLDGDGRVLPYPRPLSLRVGVDEVERVTAAELGAPTGVGPSTVGAVLVVRFASLGVVRPLRRLGRGEAVLAMVEHAVAAQSRPTDVLAAVGAVAERADVLHGVRGEAAALAARLIADPPWVSRG
jgi:hypothetical protein